MALVGLAPSSHAAVLAGDVDHVLEDLDAVLEGSVGAPLEERRVGGHADEAAALGDEAELLVGLVARMLVEAARAAVGIGDRLARVAND